ncbi:IS3 family transposase [Rossellomorea marisflavi]|uniref:IS3 family transposase n=2 Tax=Rossellomorea marisflavi TaxID=189381 RepID=UPI00345D81CB
MKYQFIQSHSDEHKVVKMCQVLNVSTSGYYKWLNRQNETNTERQRLKNEVKQKIAQSFHESFGTYGSPRVHQDLIEWGYSISQKTVARYMQDMDLRAIPLRKYVVTTDSDHDLKVYPNLLKRNFTAPTPDTIWVADITYIRTIEGWLYLASIMDLFSRKIVGWSFGTSMKTILILRALEMAITTRNPDGNLIHHSDRGTQYCSNDYVQVLKQHGFQLSMSRKGDPYDNACIESFHATLKKEWIYRTKFKTLAEAEKSVQYYISNQYNERRKHSALGYQSPNQFERNHNHELLL